MTPKEKANELVEKFIYYTPAEEEYELPYAKSCALIAVDEILEHVLLHMPSEEYDFWDEVRKEIVKL